MRTLPIVTSIEMAFPWGSATVRDCRSVTSVAARRSAAARTIHTRGLYFSLVTMRGGLRAAMMRCGALGCLLLLPLCAHVSDAQVLPEQPVSFANGRLVFGGEVTATIAPEDPGFFNYTSYAFNALRNVRFGVSAEIKASERLQLLGEVRLD